MEDECGLGTPELDHNKGLRALLSSSLCVDKLIEEGYIVPKVEQQ
jgi:hypothetical protein